MVHLSCVFIQVRQGAEKRIRNEKKESETSLILIATNNRLDKVLTSNKDHSTEQTVKRKKVLTSDAIILTDNPNATFEEDRSPPKRNSSSPKCNKTKIETSATKSTKAGSLQILGKKRIKTQNS